MKYLKIILFLFFASQQLHAQYIPLVAENKYWFYESILDNSDFPKTVAAHVITFKGDTTIFGKPYKKALQQGLLGTKTPNNFIPNIPYIIDWSEIIGYIYEDTLSKKVYYLPLNGNYCINNDNLLFNFSLKKDDTLDLCDKKVLYPYTFSSAKPKIDSVKNSFLFNKNRKSLYVQGVQGYWGFLPFGLSRITEGIGYQYFGVLINQNHKERFYKFCEGSLQDCKFSTATKNTINQAKIRVFPNPTTDKIIIESEENIESIHIYDINGKIITLDNQSNTINISHLSNGMYFIKIKFENGFQYFHKLIKQ